MIKSILNLSNHRSSHPFHLVNPSPWPIVAALGTMLLLFGTAMYLHHLSVGPYILLVGLTIIVIASYIWWTDIVHEGLTEGCHTQQVARGLRIGMLVFILSEVMLFFTFFWGFFQASLSPGIQLGAVWPPEGIQLINPFEVPLLNTVILLLSGCSITWAHHAILSSNKGQALISLGITCLLGLFFLGLQYVEYVDANFSISDSMYGTSFFMTTGFHGFHVLVGTIFLIVCFVRLYNNHFSRSHHVGFESASWYWHFVDVVWLFLYITVYIWGSPFITTLI